MPVTVPSKHKLTIDDFHKLGSAAVIGEDEHVELIEGELIDRAPIGSRHAECVSRLTRLFILQTQKTVRTQNPIDLPPHSQPEPDISVVACRDYSRAHPTKDDVFLLVEIADSSADYDRSVKIPLYARHGIPEVWLVDLEKARTEVYQTPSADGYRLIKHPANSEVITPALVPEIKIRLAELIKVDHR